MPRVLKKRQRLILQTLKGLGGIATTRQIAEELDLSVNGVAQSLGVLWPYAQWVGGNGGNAHWRLIREDF